MKELQAILSVMKQRGHRVFDDPYHLNIVGLRNAYTRPNRFDDRIVVFYRDENRRWVAHGYQATTDPGTYWLTYPMHQMGTALLKEGQYLNTWKLGLHKGQYTALVQARPVTVLRDYNRDAVLDFGSDRQETGTFGINIHRAAASSNSIEVNKWSAGCQVIANPGEFQHFINLCKTHEKFHGNMFTYTLIDLRSTLRKLKRKRLRVILGVSAIAGVALITLGVFTFS